MGISIANFLITLLTLSFNMVSNCSYIHWTDEPDSLLGLFSI